MPAIERASWALWLLIGPAWAASPPLDVSAHSPAVLDAAGHVDATLDPGATWSFAEARAAEFTPVGAADFSRPPGDADAWLRLRVHNTGATPVDRVLTLDFRLIDSVRIWIERGGALTVADAGEDTALADRLVAHALPLVPLRLEPDEQVSVWLRLRDLGAIDAPLFLQTWGAVSTAESDRNLVHGLFMGTVLLLLTFSLYLAMARREALYAWFALYLAAELFLSLVYFWGGAGVWVPAELRPGFVNRAIVGGAVAMFWASLGFADHLLEMGRFSRPTRLLRFAYPALLIAVLLAPFSVAVALSAMGILPLLIPVGVSLARARQRDRVARLYALSWGLLLLAVVAVYLRVIGVLPARFPTAYFLYAGFFLQFSALCAAMARRLRTIERERRKALEAEVTAYRRNAALSRSFERFVPKAFLDRLDRASITEIELGNAVSKRMTVLFSDIRSFTTLVEQMSPEENFAFVNEYLSYMEPAIHQHLGFIDKYIGDAVMALFDDDVGDTGGVQLAAQAAIRMHEALGAYNTLRGRRGEEPVRIGIGLHTGTLMLGTIGGQERLNASVIGDAVNLASRVEGLTKRYGAATLISGAALECLPEDAGMRLRWVDRVRVKGKSEPVDVYQLLDCEVPAVMTRRLATRAAYEAARELLSEGDVAGALAGFEGVLAEDPEDRAARLQVELCQRLLREGLPEGWDGAVRLDEK